MVVCNLKKCKEEIPPVIGAFPDEGLGVVTSIVNGGITALPDANGAVIIPPNMASVGTVTGGGAMLENEPLTGTIKLDDGTYYVIPQGLIAQTTKMMYEAFSTTDKTKPVYVLIEDQGSWEVFRTIG